MAMPFRISIDLLKFVLSPCLLTFIAAIFLSLTFCRVLFFESLALLYRLTRTDDSSGSEPDR